jgi:hypothetical protein
MSYFWGRWQHNGNLRTAVSSRICTATSKSTNNNNKKNNNNCNNKDKTCLLIDVTIPSVRNVIQKQTENKSKSTNVEYGMLCHSTGATEIETKELKDYLETIAGKHSVDSQKNP